MSGVNGAREVAAALGLPLLRTDREAKTAPFYVAPVDRGGQLRCRRTGRAYWFERPDRRELDHMRGVLASWRAEATAAGA